MKNWKKYWSHHQTTNHGIKGLKAYEFRSHKSYQGSKLIRVINATSLEEATKSLTRPRP